MQLLTNNVMHFFVGDFRFRNYALYSKGATNWGLKMEESYKQCVNINVEGDGPDSNIYIHILPPLRSGDEI
jgi:hypothetical protein